MSEPASPRPRSNVALIISLCVNLLLAGVIATALMRFALHGPMFGHHGFDRSPAQNAERVQVRQALSPRVLMHVAPEKEDQIRAVLRTHHDRIDALRGEAMATRRHVLDVFEAQKFDKAAFGEALKRMQVADAALETEVLQVVSESADLLTPDERHKVATWQGRGFGGEGHGMHWRHGRDDRDRPPPGEQQPPPQQ
jgi:uncharacterized membrane protein